MSDKTKEQLEIELDTVNKLIEERKITDNQFRLERAISDTDYAAKYTQHAIVVLIGSIVTAVIAGLMKILMGG